MCTKFGTLWPPEDRIRLLVHYTIFLASLYRLVSIGWTYKILVRNILSSVCLRLNPFSQSFYAIYWAECFRIHISLTMNGENLIWFWFFAINMSCLRWARISYASSISMSRNEKRCKYVYLFPSKKAFIVKSWLDWHQIITTSNTFGNPIIHPDIQNQTNQRVSTQRLINLVIFYCSVDVKGSDAQEQPPSTRLSTQIV